MKTILYNYFYNIYKYTKEKYLLSVFIAFISQMLALIWLNPFISLGQDTLYDLTLLQYVRNGVDPKILPFKHNIPYYVLLVILSFTIGLSLTIVIKDYLYKSHSIFNSFLFFFKHLFKIFILTLIKVCLVFIGTLLLIIPGLFLYAKLIKADFYLIDYPDESIYSIIKKSLSESNSMFKKVYLNIPFYLIFIILSDLKMLIFARNIFDISFFNLFNFGFYGIYYLVIPILYAYYISIITNYK